MVTHAPTLSFSHTQISVKREAHVSQLTSVLPGGSCIESGSVSLPVSATIIVPLASKYWLPTAVQMQPDFPYVFRNNSHLAVLSNKDMTMGKDLEHHKLSLSTHTHREATNSSDVTNYIFAE